MIWKEDLSVHLIFLQFSQRRFWILMAHPQWATHFVPSGLPVLLCTLLCCQWTQFMRTGSHTLLFIDNLCHWDDGTICNLYILMLAFFLTNTHMLCVHFHPLPLCRVLIYFACYLHFSRTMLSYSVIFLYSALLFAPFLFPFSFPITRLSLLSLLLWSRLLTCGPSPSLCISRILMPTQTSSQWAALWGWAAALAHPLEVTRSFNHLHSLGL